MAGRENNQSMLTRCVQYARRTFLWAMLESFYQPLTCLCRKDVLLMNTAIIMAAIFAVTFVSSQALPQDKAQIVLMMIPSLTLMANVYMKSPGFTLFMRWPSPVSHEELNVSTILSLFLFSAAYTDWSSSFPWTFCFVLALAVRLGGLCSWLGRVHRLASAKEVLLSDLKLWFLYFPVDVLGLSLRLVIVMFGASAVGLVMCVSFGGAVITSLLLALLVVQLCWVNDSLGLDSVMGLYGSLLLILSYGLTALQEDSTRLWVSRVIVNYCAQTFIAFSTIHATAFMP